MKSPLIYDQGDSKWSLLGNILKIFDSRRVKQEIAKQGIKPALKAGVVFRVLMIAMFFSEDVSYVIRELKEREELRKFAKLWMCHLNSKYTNFYQGFQKSSSQTVY
jgi:hypothetical protein